MLIVNYMIYEIYICFPAVKLQLVAVAHRDMNQQRWRRVVHGAHIHVGHAVDGDNYSLRR